MEDLVMPGFWSGRRVLISGHTGFKGAWLSLWLQDAGAEVTGVSLPPDRTTNLFETARVAEGMASFMLDVRNSAAVDEAVASARPEIVFHLAAQSLVRRGYRDPTETYATNVLGLVHVLEAVRRSADARCCIVVTSDKCYENREWLWAYRESDRLGGRDPYSSSKACAELVTQSYRDSFFRDARKGLASARAGNVVGGGDWSEDRLVPDAIGSFSAGIPVRIRRPDAVRPWQHVLDALLGYVTLAERLWSEPEVGGAAWNFGPSDEDTASVRRVVEMLAAGFGNGARWEPDPDAGPHEAGQLRVDSSKARRLLGWRPRLSLATALDWIVEWHQAQSSRQDMRAATIGQIRRFQVLSGAGL